MKQKNHQTMHPKQPKKVANTKFGPSKSYGRAIDKPITNLNDLNRVTVEFQNPLALALYYFALAKHFTIAGMRNKHEQPDGYTQPPCVHIMLDWGDGI